MDGGGEALAGGAAGPGGLPPGAAEPLGPEEKAAARLAGGVLAGLGAASMLGASASLYLVNHGPLLLVALSPLGRHIMLAAATSDPVWLVAVAVLRRMAFYLASFHLGRALGPRGIVWLELRAASFARFVRWLERLFGRAPRAVVLLMSGPTVSALAGISGMRAPVFAALAGASLVVRMALLVAFAEWLREPIEALLVWIDRYWIPGTVLMVGAVLVYQWRRRAFFVGSGD